MNKEFPELEKKVKSLLADFLGIESEDIEDDFSLTEDLHMKPTDLTDFIQILEKSNFNIDKIDFTEIETFAELVDELVQHQ
jgi:acyl carrier protein